MPTNIEDLLHAIDSGDLRRVQKLTKKDPSLLQAVIRPGRNRDYRPLTEAAVACQLEILSYLIESGCDVEEDACYPMFRAALYDNCVPALQMLVENGADVNGVWDDYGPAIIASCEGRSLVTMEWLLKNGAAITGTAQGATREVTWNAMAHTAHVEKHRRGLLALLIDHGGDVNSQHPDNDALGNTALHNVAKRGDTPGVRMLLSHGADRDIKNAAGKKPIDLTRNKQVRALLEK